MIFIFTPTSYGNSAEPPSILIIVPNAPDELEISIGSDNKYVKAKKTDNFFEKYYVFYLGDLRFTNDYNLKVDSTDSSFKMFLEKPIKSYNNIFTLDLNNHILASGKLLSRSIILVFLRMILTILIEAIVFWLFGFRFINSWIIFLVINLMTQGILNIWLNGFTPLEGYMIVKLIFGEILVFTVEIIAFLTFIQEHRRMRTFLYVITANLLSLFAGGFIITILPI